MINPAFHTENIKLMLPAFYDSCDGMILKWEKLIPEGGSGQVDVRPDLTTLSIDVIPRAVLGSSYTEGQKIFQLLKEKLV